MAERNKGNKETKKPATDKKAKKLKKQAKSQGLSA